MKLVMQFTPKRFCDMSVGDPFQSKDLRSKPFASLLRVAMSNPSATILSTWYNVVNLS
jgi:hypothetical protein